MTGESRAIELRADDGSTCTVQLHGAHVTSWTTPDGREQLYLSRRAVLDGSAPIRGGIPVIFPQFAADGPLPKHGFARTMRWTMLEASTSGRVPFAVLGLAAGAETRKVWPVDFEARLRVELVAGSLQVGLSVRNAGDVTCAFTAALHTYLALDDALSARVRGLGAVRYRDSAADGSVSVQGPDDLLIEGPVNRIYLDVPGDLVVFDGSRTLRSEMRGFRDVVIWNPGREGEGAFGDMEPGDARRMICVEAAAVGSPVALAPGQSWSGSQTIRAARAGD